MDFFETIRSNRKPLLEYQLAGVIVGALYAFTEFFIRLETTDPQALIPLLIRGVLSGWLIVVSVGLFELFFKQNFVQKRFWFLVLVRAFSFTLIITFWLSIVNAVWLSIDRNMSVAAGFAGYLTDISYLINLISVLLVLAILIGLQQINSLHRKGELLKFILGKYHKPREIERLFCFIDLKDSTTIAEQLGHLKFGMFLKDYYSDITEAIRKTQAEIYQYVGDEIILSWPMDKGLQNNNVVRCYFLMQELIETYREKYLKKYGLYPRFKAGVHGGPIIVTWVGELKKEIMYLGDVVNTTSRIQESCKRLAKDFLISQDVLDQLDDLGNITAAFVEETAPRGKMRKVRVFSLEQAA